MTLSLETILRNAGIDPAEAIAIRHAFVPYHEDTGEAGIHANSTNQEIMTYSSQQDSNPRLFPGIPPRYWVVFIREGGSRARLWSVVENRGEIANDGTLRTFDLVATEHLAELRDRLVIGWKVPRRWWLNGPTAAEYPVVEIADAQTERFPGFEQLILDYPKLQAVMTERRYGEWQSALSAVKGVYLITDTSDGRHYVGKADGAENITQRWRQYALDGHGGNVELRGLDPRNFRFSLLRVFDPSTPTKDIDQAESHYKKALASRMFGLNRN